MRGFLALELLPGASMPGLAPSPLWGEGGGEGLQRWSRLLKFDFESVLHALAGRDVRPAAQFLSLTRQRKEPKKATPTSATPALRCGANLRRNACGVRRRTHCALARSVQTTAASQSTKRVHAALHAPPRKRRAAGAASRGWKNHTGHRCARPGQKPTPGPSAAMARVGVQVPSGRAEKRRAWGGHGQRSMPMHRDLTCCGCLSAVNEVNAASSAAPPRARASQVARSEAKGHGQWGRLFFAYFLLATQKKVGAPPGAYPGPQAHAEPQKKQRTVNNSNASGPSPQPSPQRGEGARPHIAVFLKRIGVSRPPIKRKQLQTK